LFDWNYLQSEYFWVSKVFIIVFATLVLDFIQRRILKKLAKRLEHTANPWDDALLEAIRRPIVYFIWVLGFSFAARYVQYDKDIAIFDLIQPFRDIGVIAILTWFLVRLIKQTEINIIKSRQAKGGTVDLTTMDAIAKLLRLSVIITAALITLQTLGFSVSGVLAFGGVGGIAIGFAARDLLANFFGGLMIYLDRPFSVGEWIRSPDRSIEGTVEKIGWRLTIIRTFDKRPLYVPNSVFATIAVENPSRMANRRIYETIGIRYDDATKMAPILNDIEKMLKSHPAIDTDQTLMVNFNSFAPSSLDFFVYTFTKTTVWTEFHQIKQAILLKINEIISEHGAQIAFPTSTIHIAPDSDHSNVKK